MRAAPACSVVLAFERVTRVYREGGTRRAALDGVTFHLERGERVGLAGENGSGKSTLLRLAATLDEPTSGTIRVDGATGAAARRRIGYLGQDAGLYGALNVRENLAFGARLHGRAGDVASVAAQLGVPLDASARALSRGERQRVVLARAFLAGELLLLDEPTTALDAEGRDRFLRLLDATGGRTALVATHDDAVLAKCDRVLRLHGGRLQ